VSQAVETARLAPILRYAGGKHKLAPWIISHMPAHRAYVEPFCGSCAVLLAKRPVSHEMINDRNGDVVNLFRVVREQPEALCAAISLTPYARDEFRASHEIPDDADPVERARLFLVRVWFAHGGKLGTAAGWRMGRVARKPSDSMPAAWDRLPDRVWEVVGRLKQVHIENRDFREVLPMYLRSEALIYADPPYVRSTLGSDRHYTVDMTDADHLELLDLLDAHPGPVLLSGYSSPLYDDRLAHWTRLDVQVNAYRSSLRTESLWLNAVATSGRRQLRLEGHS
jgi:DNA adenine methylase